jgi:hypothetical protein
MGSNYTYSPICEQARNLTQTHQLISGLQQQIKPNRPVSRDCQRMTNSPLISYFFRSRNQKIKVSSLLTHILWHLRRDSWRSLRIIRSQINLQLLNWGIIVFFRHLKLSFSSNSTDGYVEGVIKQAATSLKLYNDTSNTAKAENTCANAIIRSLLLRHWRAGKIG